MNKITRYSYVVIHYIVLCCLVGCATQPTPPSTETLSWKSRKQSLANLNAFEANGKIGFSDGQQGGHASVEWRQQHSDYFIHLYGPLGSGSVQIVGQANQVYLIQSNGQKIMAKTPEDLVQQAFGWTIPVSGLRYWLRGLPAPGSSPQQMQFDPQNRITQLVQNGWTVHYQTYQSQNGVDVPHKLTLKNGNIRLKFIFNQWSFN